VKPHQRGRPTQIQVSKPRLNVDAEIIEILRGFALANPRQGDRKAYLAAQTSRSNNSHAVLVSATVQLFGRVYAILHGR
jgi:hypothetical protein